MPITAKYLFALIIFAVFHITTISAQHNEVPEEHGHTDLHQSEEFDAGKFVIEHVLDSYEWHIAGWGDKHYSIPLPVILYSLNPEFHGGKRFHVFMSSKFNHGHDDYRGFRISHTEEHNHKIVEVDQRGNELGRPIDLSLTKVVAGAVVSAILLIALALVAVRNARHNRGGAPSGVQNLLEPVIVFIRDEIAKPSIGPHYKKFMPPLLTLFFFILLTNLLGLIPIFPFGANVTGNISVTMVLALFTFLVTAIRGNANYWKEVFNPDVPTFLKFPIPLMPFLELVGMFTKPFVLMIRLFANMLAGHLIIMVFISLIFIFSNLMGPAAGYGVSPVSVAFSVFIMLLDVLVSFIQAYVFTLLSAIYFGMATAEHH